MFGGAYRTAFYRALADAIHADVRGGDTVETWELVHKLRASRQDIERVA
jgi:hypothetical protein